MCLYARSPVACSPPWVVHRKLFFSVILCCGSNGAVASYLRQCTWSPSAWLRLYGSCPETLGHVCSLISVCHVLCSPHTSSTCGRVLCCVHLPSQAVAAALSRSSDSRIRCSARTSHQITEHESSSVNLLRPCRVCRRVGGPSSRV